MIHIIKFDINLNYHYFSRVKKTTMLKKTLLTGLFVYLINFQAHSQSYYLLNDQDQFTRLEYNFKESPLTIPYIVYKIKLNERETYFFECGPETEKSISPMPNNVINADEINQISLHNSDLYILNNQSKAIKVNFVSVLNNKSEDFTYSSWKYVLNKDEPGNFVAYNGFVNSGCLTAQKFTKSFPQDDSYYTEILFHEKIGVIEEHHHAKSGKTIFELESVNGIALSEWIQRNCGPVLTERGVPNVKVHGVQKGETLFTISRLYGVSVNELKILNSLTSDAINVGDILVISELKEEDKKTPFWVNAGEYHVVKPGETIAYLALKFGYTEQRLRYMNGLSDKEPAKIGQKLIVSDCGINPGKNQSLIETNPELFDGKYNDVQGRNKTEEGENPLLKRGLPKSYDSGSRKIHKVAQGETIFSIAKQYGISTEVIRKLNNLSSSDLLKTGQILQVE
jgi:LysM repeat protein